MTHKKISLALLAVAAAAALAWGVLGRSTTQGAAGGPAAKPVQTVSVVAAQLRDLPVSYEAAGTAVALNTVEIRPQLSSTVRQVAIQEGQNVARGQLLFTFDDRNERANLDKARAQLARDRATLADLERQLRRAQDLKAQNFVADNAVDTVQSQVDAQQATLQSDAAALAAAEVALSYTSVRAPLAGRAGAINVYPGSLVQPSGAALVTISQMDPIGVSFNLPEAELAGRSSSTCACRAHRAARAPAVHPPPAPPRLPVHPAWRRLRRAGTACCTSSTTRWMPPPARSSSRAASPTRTKPCGRASTCRCA